MARRHYTEDQVGHALAVLRSMNGNYLRASKNLGIARATLKMWSEDQKYAGHIDPSKVAVVESEASDRIASTLEVMVPEMLALAREKMPSASFKDLLVGSGIGIEKIQLLRGKPTSRSEGIKVSLVLPGGLKNLAVQVVTGQPIEPTPVQLGPEPIAIEGEIIRETQ